MTRPVHCPLGCWPSEMRAETAAAYVDEKSVEAFLAKVARREYPQPTRRPGVQDKWHRNRLDQAIARRHGLIEPELLTEDVEELI